jgi:hypothetical protein
LVSTLSATLPKGTMRLLTALLLFVALVAAPAAVAEAASPASAAGCAHHVASADLTHHSGTKQAPVKMPGWCCMGCCVATMPLAEAPAVLSFGLSSRWPLLEQTVAALTLEPAVPPPRA